MMSVVPVDPPGQIDVAHSATLSAAIQRAADLSQYTATQLSQTYNWVVGYSAGQSPAQMAASIGATSQGPTNLIANSVVFSFPASVTAQDAANRLATLGGKTFDFPLVPIDRTTYSFVPAGSLFPQQWHLNNTGQVGGTPGADANVLPVWATGDLGQGTIIGVVDSGVYGAHPDLAPNYRSDLSYNFLEDNYDATPPAPIGPEDSHGTEVAGVAAASGTTLDGTVGVAPQAQIAGIRAIGGPITDQAMANALELNNQTIQIYNNSWGPALSNFGVPSPESPLVLAALQDGAQNGRNGLGSIYVFAAGNGLAAQSDVNYDGDANSRFVIAVTGVDEYGKQTTYGVPGAAVLVAAPTGHDYQGAADEHGIPTTTVINATNLDGSATLAPSYVDSGPDGFNGTSSAAPVVSGVVALMLQANPKLSYRDVQMILAETATQNDPGSGWTGNGASFTTDGKTFTPFHINNMYGFGTVNAAAAVALAKQWSPLPAENVVSSPVVNVNAGVPDGVSTGVTSTVTFSGANLHMEHAEVILTATHAARNDLTITLTSPNGTQSVLAATRTTDYQYDASGNVVLDKNGNPVHNANYTNYVFTTVRDWGENSNGTWKLQVSDRTGNGVAGTFNSWQLNLYGTTDYAPIALDVSASTGGSTPVNVDLTSNTYDYNLGGPATGSEISIASQPGHGVVSYNPTTGVVTYTPVPGFSGPDTFTYLVTDGQGHVSRAATVTINVAFSAQAPNAHDDTAGVALGTTVVIDILSNDTDPNVGATLNPASVQIVTPPEFGSVSINQITGAVSYTPGGAFQISDSFQYTVSDNKGGTSNVATVTINRLSAAPTAVSDSVATGRNQPTAIDVLANDLQGSPDLSLDPSTVAIVNAPQNGSVSINPTTGAATYTPKANFYGQDSFSYTVADIAHNVSNTATVSIMVMSAGAPLALDHEFVLVPGYGVIRGISALDNPTGSGSLTVRLVQQAALGTVTVAPDGSFSYIQGPNFHGLDTFLYQVNDGSQDSNVGSVRLVSPQFHYIEKLYQTLLGRTGSDADILHWSGLLSQGVSRNSIAEGFLNSAEYQAHVVNGIYQQLLGRSADVGGTNFWVGQLQAGVSIPTVQAAIASSFEYFARHGSTNAGFVAGLYQDFLGRSAGQAEISSWTTAMSQGKSAASVALGFVGSTEYRTTLITSYYQTYLGHVPDQGGLNNWLFVFSLGYPRTTIQAGILASNEYYNIQ